MKRGSGLVVFLFLFLLAGCGRPFSNEALLDVNWEVDFASLIADPSIYKEKVLLLGGMIVENESGREGTRLEIVSRPLDRWDKPEESEESEGRFLADSEKLLPPDTYKVGRLVTLVGVVKGSLSKPLKNAPYLYPLLEVRDIHLWDRYEHGDHYYYHYDPWYYGYPYYRYRW